MDMNTPETQRRAMRLVMDAGKLLLENGGEVFRVQQTMQFMAESLNIEGFNTYVVTNGIFASANACNEVRHIPSVSIHLARVEAVNELSFVFSGDANHRDVHALPPRRSPALETQRPAMLIGAAAAGSACFGYLFGGGLPETLAALAAGAVESILVQLCRRWHVSRIFSDIISAAAGTAVALLCRVLWPALDVSTAAIGALMVLTPGVSLAMGIRDIINADYLSGAIRLLDAVLVAGCLAGGVVLTYTAALAIWGVAI